jgi:hypothetical protein
MTRSSEVDEKVLSLARQLGGISATTIHDNYGWDSVQIAYVIRRLVRKGELVYARKIPTKGRSIAWYEVKEKT